MGKKSTQKITKRAAKPQSNPGFGTNLPVGDGFKIVEVQGQKVQVFAELGYASQAATRLVELVNQLGRVLPMGDAVELFVEIKQGLQLVNNTLVIEAQAAQNKPQTQTAAEPVGKNELLKD